MYASSENTISPATGRRNATGREPEDEEGDEQVAHSTGRVRPDGPGSQESISRKLSIASITGLVRPLPSFAPYSQVT